MKTDLQVFSNDLFGEIRILTENDKVLFCGKDIASALGYVRPRDAIRKHCKGASFRSVPTSSGVQEMSFIPEGDLYRLIIKSQLPSAEKFEKWVFDEVLPQIRQTGGYIPISSQDDDLSIMAKAHQILERTLQEKENILIERTKALEIAQPKADKYDKLMNANGYISFNIAAKQLGTGRNRLMKFLRENNILFRDGLSNIAYQTYCERGYFVVKFSTGKNGYACGVTKVTPKGLEFLCDLLEGNNIA